MGMISTPSTKGTVFETLPVYDARELTEGGDLARIRLADQLYTLRITRAGKLILTK
ncbi:hemin uptake protein HemP [Antarctobacter sp.]|uniref:hemin uptake protein HemP n=1 Tax=Antarctobacter sp. TaxID=1872577 RepID=UPI002B27AC20|nr:hemin uptake protein HemP [Antarctobacter sp.]